MHQIKIDHEACIKCKKCVAACLYDVIVWDQEKKLPFAKYPQECATCSWCEIKCPAKAISVIPENPVPYPEYYPEGIYPKMDSILTLNNKKFKDQEV